MIHTFAGASEHQSSESSLYEHPRESVVAFFRELGIEDHELHETIIERLALIETRYRRFNDDSRMICRGLRNLFDYITHTSPQQLSISETEINKTVLAGFIHDIGKSGPATVGPEHQAMVVDIYGIEGVRDGTASISSVLREHRPEDADRFLSLLSELGITEHTTMREFWNLHGVWTHDILEQYQCAGIDRETRIIAGSHHIAEGINPYHVTDSTIPLGAIEIGALEQYLDVIEERALIIIDKYQASRRRSETSHETAMTVVRSIIEKKFDHDPIMQFILSAIDTLGSREALFDIPPTPLKKSATAA
ncbi:MAG: hypothetical protein RIQ54_80 [Candidatus Parcubacteria bacterium]|jgi:hypothetical protein